MNSACGEENILPAALKYQRTELTANSNTSPTHAGTVLIAEIDKEEKYKDTNDKFENF